VVELEVENGSGGGRSNQSINRINRMRALWSWREGRKLIDAVQCCASLQYVCMSLLPAYLRCLLPCRVLKTCTCAKLFPVFFHSSIHGGYVRALQPVVNRIDVQRSVGSECKA
jgi:hypothetical protein